MELIFGEKTGNPEDNHIIVIVEMKNSPLYMTKNTFLIN